jgi:hypothetical protein
LIDIKKCNGEYKLLVTLQSIEDDDFHSVRMQALLPKDILLDILTCNMLEPTEEMKADPEDGMEAFKRLAEKMSTEMLRLRSNSRRRPRRLTITRA